jgi:segregation and condensation protein B
MSVDEDNGVAELPLAPVEEDKPPWRASALEPRDTTADVVPEVPQGRLPSVVESLLLAADRPLTAVQIAALLDVPADDVRAVLEAWQRELEARSSGIQLTEVAGGFRLRTAHANAPWVRALTGKRPVRLSRAALECIAIVAYKQPATRSEVEDVRGVDSSVVLRSLLEKDLLRIVGRKDEPGRPMLYGTTRRFQEVFGLSRMSDLPSLREFADLAVGEQEGLFDDRTLEDGGAAAAEESQDTE